MGNRQLDAIEPHMEMMCDQAEIATSALVAAGDHPDTPASVRFALKQSALLMGRQNVVISFLHAALIEATKGD